MATLKENFYKNRGLAVNPLIEGLLPEIKKDEVVSSGEEEIVTPGANPGQLFNTFVRSLRRKSNSNSPYGMSAGKLHDYMQQLSNQTDRKSQINVLRNVLSLAGIRISAKDANRLIDSYIEMYPDVDVSPEAEKAGQDDFEARERAWKEKHPGRIYRGR